MAESLLRDKVVYAISSEKFKREILSLGKRKNEAGKIEIYQNNLEIGSHDPLEEEIRAFVGSVMTRSKPSVSGEDGRKSLALAMEILQKMKTHEDIQL